MIVVPAPRRSRPSTRVRRLAARALVVSAAALLAGCDGSGQSGSAFVFLSVDAFSQDGQTPIAAATSTPSRSVSTTACVTLRNNLKSPTVTAPTALDNVTIHSYTVQLRRPDGGLLFAPFTIGASVVVPAGTATQGVVSGNTRTFGVVLVPAGSKGNFAPLIATAEIVFKGRDGRGANVETQGGIAVQFVGSGQDTTCGATGGGTPPPPPDGDDGEDGETDGTP